MSENHKESYYFLPKLHISPCVHIKLYFKLTFPLWTDNVLYKNQTQIKPSVPDMKNSLSGLMVSIVQETPTVL